MANVNIKRHDNGIVFTDTLTVGGAAYDLTGANVLFIMKRSGSVFSDGATITDPPAGMVSYAPGEGFPTELGEYEQEWEVESGGRKITFPVKPNNKITILADLNNA